MKKKNHYSSGDYYQNIYITEKMNLNESTLWMSNHFSVIKSIFPDILNHKESKILEIGSGYGGFINQLNIRGYQNVVASDMSDRIFYNKLKNEFKIIDLLEYEDEINCYDVIFAFDVMEHINDTRKAILNLSKMLKKDGLFIFCTPYPEKKHLMDRYHTNMQYPSYYTNLFHRSDFEILKMEDVSFVPYIWRLGFPIFIKKVLKNKYLLSETFFVFKKII